MAGFEQTTPEDFLEREATVVRADSDFHGSYYRS
jgi:hypothetical protein